MIYAPQILISYSSFFVARTNGARFGLTIIAFLALLNFITGQLNRIPNVAYHVRLLSFLYLRFPASSILLLGRTCHETTARLTHWPVRRRRHITS